ncbi:hypothetical protein [Allobranchiibius sp. GilTou73]|uniref:hypothetical protein n=1 Tax=Allobranchiibius sp. GilTou73 TaxID=2904523 RepID=UPI00351D5DF3
MDAAHAGAAHVTALDVSRTALDEVAHRASDSNVGDVIRVQIGDFWSTEAACWCGRPGLLHEQVTSDLACPEERPGRMLRCPSPTPSSSARTWCAWHAPAKRA